jgi:outer membrane protein OmpA-like peptidoglycan-associated protein
MRALLIPAVALLGGCMLWGGGPRETPPNPELERSRALIAQAARNPTVSEHFKDDLARARAALDQADMIWSEERGKLDEDDEEWIEIRHLNHMARQRTALAVMKARALDARRELQALQSGTPPRPGVTGKPPAAAAGPGLSALPAPLRSLQPRLESRGLVLTLDDRHFESGGARLLDGAAAPLDAVLQYLVANPAKNLACEGYSEGAETQKLSQQRARVVQQELLERGLELSRVTAVGYGTAGNGSGTRVELVISDTPAPDYDRTP